MSCLEREPQVSLLTKIGFKRRESCRNVGQHGTEGTVSWTPGLGPSPPMAATGEHAGTATTPNLTHAQVHAPRLAAYCWSM
jgi:hypothetical protein